MHLDASQVAAELDIPASKASGANGPIVVMASFDESASLFGRDGHTADSYRSRYEVQYHVVKAKGGAEGGAGWRIAKIVVVSEDGEGAK